MIDAVEKIKSTYENKNTQSAYLNMLRKIQNEFGDIFGVELEPFFVWVLSTLSPNTGNVALNTLKIFITDTSERNAIEEFRAIIKSNATKDKVQKNKELVKKLPTLSKIRAESYKHTNNRSIIISYLILNYYIRNMDLYIKIVASMKDTKDKNWNYLVLHKAGVDKYKCRYVRNLYKTVGTYGVKTHEIRNQRFIKAVIEYMNTEGTYLLGGQNPVELKNIQGYISTYTPFNLREGDIFKIVVADINKNGNLNDLQRASERRGTDVQTIIEEYHITNNRLK